VATSRGLLLGSSCSEHQLANPHLISGFIDCAPYEKKEKEKVL